MNLAFILCLGFVLPPGNEVEDLFRGITLSESIVCQQTLVPDKEGWVTLFNGKNYLGFNFYIPQGPEYTFDVKDGCMYLKAPLLGYTYTRQRYRNYELKFDWKYERPADLVDESSFTGNSGVLLHINRILKNWPQSIEVDLKNNELGKLLVHGKASVECKEYPEARQQATKAVGDWNTILIFNQEGNIRVTVNGKLVVEGTTDLREGHIGFQAAGSNVLLRNIQLREIK
ncbi:MAG TPA: DUF1080 domain-containing protein [Gemmatales bacterium]|nr:DUF1080 domain-containing protein [Gemmatales bacterium]